jgi:hypothetical protein
MLFNSLGKQSDSIGISQAIIFKTFAYVLTVFKTSLPIFLTSVLFKTTLLSTTLAIGKP